MFTVESALRRSLDGAFFGMFLFIPFVLVFVSVYARQQRYRWDFGALGLDQDINICVSDAVGI